jgi:hypothetical protein
VLRFILIELFNFIDLPDVLSEDIDFDDSTISEFAEQNFFSAEQNFF